MKVSLRFRLDRFTESRTRRFAPLRTYRLECETLDSFHAESISETDHIAKDKLWDIQIINFYLFLGPSLEAVCLFAHETRQNIIYPSKNQLDNIVIVIFLMGTWDNWIFILQLCYQRYSENMFQLYFLSETIQNRDHNSEIHSSILQSSSIDPIP